jgi:hypothetical protein
MMSRPRRDQAGCIWHPVQRKDIDSKADSDGLCITWPKIMPKPRQFCGAALSNVDLERLEPQRGHPGVEGIYPCHYTPRRDRSARRKIFYQRGLTAIIAIA